MAAEAASCVENILYYKCGPDGGGWAVGLAGR